MTISIFWLELLVNIALFTASLVPVLFLVLIIRDWRQGKIW